MNLFEKEKKEFNIILKDYNQIYDGNVISFTQRELEFESNMVRPSTKRVGELIKDLYYNELTKLKSKSKTYYFPDEQKADFIKSLSTNSLKISNINISPRFVFINDDMLTSLGLYGFSNDSSYFTGDMKKLITLVHNSTIYKYNEDIEEFGTGLIYLVSDPILNMERFIDSLKYEINGDNHKITYYEYECMYNVIRVVFRDKKSWRLSVINSVLD